MISEQQIYAIGSDWEGRTPEEKEQIRLKADRLRAEAQNLGPFYGANCKIIQSHSKEIAECLVDGYFGLPDDGDDGIIPVIELAVLEELRNPAILAWDRAVKYISEALEDSVILENPDTVKVLESYSSRLGEDGYGFATADCIDPPWDLTRQRVISWQAKNNASKKNVEPRAWVLTEWESRPDLGQSKASFARQYVPLVKQRFGVLVTEDTIKRDWLPKSAK